MQDHILWEEELHGGQTWSQVLQRGMSLRFTDLVQRKEDAELRQMLSRKQEFELKMDSLQRLRYVRSGRPSTCVKDI